MYAKCICMQNAYYLIPFLSNDNMAKEAYTSIRVTKNVRNSLQNYVEACYSDLSINSMLKVHMENLQEGHVRFPKYGIYALGQPNIDG